MLIWKRGEPAPQSSSVTLNCVESVVTSDSFRPAGTVKSIQLASFAVVASEKSDTSLTFPIPASAAPCSVKSAARALGAAANATAAQARTATASFFMRLSPFRLPHGPIPRLPGGTRPGDGLYVTLTRSEQ